MKRYETKQDNFETTRLPKTSQANGTSESSESSELINKNVPNTFINFKFPQTISNTLYQVNYILTQSIYLIHFFP